MAQDIKAIIAMMAMLPNVTDRAIIVVCDAPVASSTVESGKPTIWREARRLAGPATATVRSTLAVSV
jgi:hypothetical protein